MDWSVAAFEKQKSEHKSTMRRSVVLMMISNQLSCASWRCLFLCRSQKIKQQPASHKIVSAVFLSKRPSGSVFSRFWLKSLNDIRKCCQLAKKVEGSLLSPYSCPFFYDPVRRLLFRHGLADVEIQMMDSGKLKFSTYKVLRAVKREKVSFVRVSQSPAGWPLLHG